MKRISLLLLAAMLLLTAGCAGTPKANAPDTAETAQSIPAAAATAPATDISGSYTYTFTGLMGEETMQLDFADGTVTISLPGNAMITDVYQNAYTDNGDGSVSIAGLKNVDSASPYAIPGLWGWIDGATGACTVLLDEGAKTFMPADGAPESQAPNEAAAPADTGDSSLSDIAYATASKTQTLDLLLPQGDGPFPLVILIHGGGFKFGDKQMDIVQKMFALTDAGYAVATVNYRLSGEAAFPAAVADVKAAVRFLRANAAEYRLDAARFAIWGESAGAYLAAMTAVTADGVLVGDVADNADTSSGAKVLIDFYGPISFYLMDEDAASLGQSSATGSESSFESAFIGKAIDSLTAEEKAEIDPITYLSAERPLAVWIQAGDADTSVPCLQSKRFAEACQTVYGEDAVFFALIPDASHMDDAFYTEENLAALIAFLDAHL